MEYRKEIIRQQVDGEVMETEVYLPDIELPEQKPIGIYGSRYRKYLKEHRRGLYYSLLTSGRLNDTLAEVDERSHDFLERVIRQMAEREGVTEKLKAEDMMAWVGKMNNIRSRAEEMLNEELYAL